MGEAPQAVNRIDDEPLIIRIDRIIYRFARRWLLILNLVALFLASMPFIIPYLASQGIDGLANGLYAGFGLICHQIPEHSFTVFGEQVVICHRCVAIYGTSFIVGLGYVFFRHRLTPLGFLGLILLATPMGIDGFTQLLGMRESTWLLRFITGSLFAFGVMWFALPRLEAGFAEIRGVVEQRFDKLVRQGRSNPL